MLRTNLGMILGTDSMSVVGMSVVRMSVRMPGLDIIPNWIPAQGPSMDREIGVNVVKPELDLNQLDYFNMEIKDEPLKDEPVIIKDEVRGVTYTQKLKSKIGRTQALKDCTIRLLCVFSLDRFGDYVLDQVVAPVRETCAQVLGAALKHMPKDLVHETLSILLQMQVMKSLFSSDHYLPRHDLDQTRMQPWIVVSGVLTLGALQDMLGELLPRVLPACMVGLEDADDDVRAVAAEALTPAAAAIVSTAGDAVTVILLTLWDISTAGSG
ncbi:hypothetical protein R1sor_014372 [Riccia sorocarpa]|uniref:Uncharacterized protein n=1 Tax=Riccia sorocarpa TaxID=122646 RepID=A0ABD3H9F9_9MARC